MAQQQVQIAETIRAMKLAMKRQATDADSDSDGALPTHSNRGNKLKRSARHVQQHRLDDTGGLSYRKKAKHAGYMRTTISENPPLLDEDGDLYSPVSSDDERSVELAADNPFGEVKLEMLLRPLTSPADLPAHPSLSIPYKSTALSQMATEALAMLRKERASLWKAKRLLQRFRGDADWVPCATFETELDDILLNGDDSIEEQSMIASTTTDQNPLAIMPPIEPADPVGDNLIKPIASNAHRDSDTMDGVETTDMALAAVEVTPQNLSPGESNPTASDANANAQETEDANDTGPAEQTEGRNPLAHPALADLADQDASSETASNSNGTSTHAMTTRARARSPAEEHRTPSPTPSDSASIPPINPWYLLPPTSNPDRDLGLPLHEAEDTRKLLLLYVQKQEQVVRSLNALHSGLQKAVRLRDYVYRSCKAEGHLVPDGKGNMVTEMSDGEDWYDVEDWSLQPWELKDGKLEKGKEEVEEVEEEGRRRPGRGRRVNRI